MAIPFTLAGIGGAALGQGINFLYSQAGELIRRWQSRKDATKAAGSAASAPAPDQITIQVPPILGGRVLTVAPDLVAVGDSAAQLLRLRAALSNYADGLQQIDPADPQLARTVDELRTTLEGIFGKHLTFLGEDRPTTGQPVVKSKIQVGSVKGSVTGVGVKGGVAAGRIESELTAGDVESGGSVTGVQIGTLGQSAPPPDP
jgi:hypothetical protein